MRRNISPIRLWVLYISLASLFFLIAYQLIQLTVIRRTSLEKAAKKQHSLTVTIPPLRGAITDRNGREFATNLKIPSIYGVPRILDQQERQELIDQLGPILGLKREYLQQRLSRDKSFVWIKRKVSDEEAKKIAALKNPALGIIMEYKRFYPQGDLLSQVIGFADVDNVGIEGIERGLDKELKGREGKRYTKRDALGREIRAFDLKTIPPVNGKRVVLTIDQYIQYLTERALDKAFLQWKAEGATAIVMNPSTGEILAMANRPTFDPNEYAKSNADTRRNRSITDMYEPGSVFKIVAASAALNEKVVGVDDVFFCENGLYNYGSRTLRDVHKYGNLNFADVIVKSSNIGTVKIAARLQPTVFQSYINAYGFGKKSGFDLGGEAPGYSRPPAQWSKTSPYNIPMGHEIMVTALQVARSFSVIANGGKLVKPFIVSRIEDQHGVILKENIPQEGTQVIREEVADIMRDILVRVVEEGTGKNALIEGIPVAGKTGTAQKVLSGGRGYSHSEFISSFAGFAPADAPKLAMVVVVDNPKPRYYGGTVAAPVFKEVIEAALIYMGYVPSDAKYFQSSSPVPSSQVNQPRLLPVQTSGTRV